MQVVTDSLPTQILRAPTPHSYKTDPWLTGYHEPAFTERSILFSAFWICALCFLRELLAEQYWGLKLFWMQGMCSHFDVPKRP